MSHKKTVRFPWEPEGEKVVLETPELTSVEYRLAPFGTRIVAAVLDHLLITAVGGVMLFLSLLFMSLGGRGNVEQVFYFFALMLALWFLVGILYFVVGEVRGEGRTWGKRRMGIRTIMASGQGITLGASLVRNIARLVDNWPPLWLLPALGRGHRRLGDYLADTLVIVEGRTAVSAPGKQADLAPSYRELADKRFHFSSEVAARLYPDDLNLLEHMEERLAAASGRERQNALLSVALKYVERLGIEDASLVTENPARFLGEMKLFLRDRFEGEAY